MTPAMAQLTARELEAAYCMNTSLQKELEAASCKESLQPEELAAAYCNKTLPAFPVYLLGQTRARELKLNTAQLCKQDVANNGLTAHNEHLTGQTKAREIQLSIALCKQHFATQSLQQNELGAAYLLG